MSRFLLTVILLFGGLSAYAMDPSPLDTLPVQEGGRKKPFYVFAEESLLSLSGKTALVVDGHKQSASEIITGIWLTPEKWSSHPIILINYLPLKKAAGLDVNRKWFSRDELAATPSFISVLQKIDVERRTVKDGKLQGLSKYAAEVGERISTFESLSNGKLFRVVANPAGLNAAWSPLSADDPAYTELRIAWLHGDNNAFAKAASLLRANLAAQSPQFQPSVSRMILETIYQKVHPFRWAWMLYLAAGLTLAVTSIRGRAIGYGLGWVLAGAGLILQFGGFFSRILIAGRPPVSNMYESVIWVAFGAVCFALIFEAIYRCRYFLLGACFAAVIPLLLADFQPLALDRSIQPLVPVLQSNFWLATHVLIITLSYAAFLLALGVSHIVLGKIILGDVPSWAIYNYIYRTLQVGVLLLAIGTILGGVWANYSWGRFWDWDPKETWALVALLVYLFILHGRIAGSWSGFGLAVGSVLAFQSIIMAWYGVNFVLGVGLHSYGFGSGGFSYAVAFVVFELLFTFFAIFRYRKNLTQKVV